MSQTKAYSDQAESGIYTHQQAARKAGEPVELVDNYPRAGLSAKDPRDELMMQKMELIEKGKAAGGNVGMTQLGQVQATDADFRWLQRKRDTEAAANLDAWIGANFHTQDPAQLAWLRETYPEYFDARERIMVERAKFALRVKLLKLRGPKTEEDLILAWGLKTGRIQLDRDWDVVGPSLKPSNAVDMDIERTRYKKGLLTRRRYLSDKERANNAAGLDLTGEAVRNGNPFAPGANDTGYGGFQDTAHSMPGVAVPDSGRYASFLNDVLKPYL